MIGPNTQVIDLQGQLAIPGFIESHGHFTGVGGAQLQLNLMNVDSWDKIVAMVAEAVSHARPGQWIYGRGWHQEKWTSRPAPNVEGFPTHASLDKVSPNNPVAARARERPRGVRQRQGDGAVRHPAADREPGRRRDPARRERRRDRPDARDRAGADQARRRRAAADAGGDARRAIAEVLELASKEVLSKGITTFEDAGSPLATIDLMKKMVDEGKMGVRLWVMVRQPNADDRAEARAVQDDRLRRRPSHGARDQEADRRRARLARRLAAGALRRQARSRPVSRRPRSPRSTRPRGSRCRTASSCACTRSAIAPIARRSTSSSAPSRPIPRRRICAGASSTRSTSARRTSRASGRWA